MQIRIFQINVNTGRPEADPETVHKLADSISKVGLLNPITVDQEYTLIAGLHRLEAAKLLGWAEIECTVSNLEGLLAELAEIDENLVRRGLNCVDEGEQLARRKEIYEMLHPETRQGMRNGQTSKTAPGAVLETKPFTEDASEKLGIAPRTIRTKIQVAKKLTPETKKIVKSNDIGIKSALKLSRLAPDQQADTGSQLAAGNIHSIDQYQPVPASQKDTVGQTPEAPGQTSIPPASEGYYATTKDSVDDLKNPDKDRNRIPDSFLMTFTFFLQRFCTGLANYDIPEYDVVFPLLTKDQLKQLRHEIQSIHTALDGLFHKMERMAKK